MTKTTLLWDRLGDDSEPDGKQGANTPKTAEEIEQEVETAKTVKAAEKVLQAAEDAALAAKAAATKPVLTQNPPLHVLNAMQRARRLQTEE